MNKMNKLRNLVLTAATVGMIALTAQADSITFIFTGHVVTVEDMSGVLGGSITTGTPLSGTYTFDSLTPDSNAFPDVGDYLHTSAGNGIIANMGPFTFQTDPNAVDFLLEVVNRPLRDNYLLRSFNNIASGPLPPVSEELHIAWQLDDPTATALTSDALPLTPPDLSQWEQVFAFTVDNPGSEFPLFSSESPPFPDQGRFFIRAIIDSVSPIPEPTTLLLLGSGLAGLVGLAKLKRAGENRRSSRL